ncbi:uncharacterized protein LOC119069223 [Bradysia coprophila]|uniref:uncharacterized protein LOC119069223 n=1 Tax=Bradysia coprophila TaxID=38358 RepID=UPI00187DD97C|nr:uncharacterized protein LOC119069223 [Bradysia coprophila]
MLLSLGILLCTGVLCSEPSSTSTRTSYARGDSYGCSEKFFRHNCWKYCTGSSGKWCYTVKDSSNHCTSDNDCRWSSACQGWCAWNSQSGCSKACHEEVIKPQEQSMPPCRRGRPWWECQSSYGGGWRSGLSTGGKWISPDVPNDLVMNATANSIVFNGNSATATKSTASVPQSALWYPMGQIKVTSTTLYWTFAIRETATSSATSSVAIGLSDLNKLAPGWGVKGLFYNGPNLSDGSVLLMDNFGPKIKNGDKCSILVKLIESRMKVYIILNGKSLGLAFDVPEDTLDGIYPVVKFNGEGIAVEIEESRISDAPTELEPVKPLIMEGNWTLHSLRQAAVLTKPNVTMKISEIYDRVHERAYRIRIHAVNKFMGKLMEKSKSNWAGEIMDKTAKQGTASEMELETDISKHISAIRNVVLDTVKNELRLESAGSTSVWKQIESRRTTVNFNPFKKVKN